MKFKGDLDMKATGIVRRIDDLGRVVIPKEIRRTLRIREGDPLEIYTATDGEVIFKKYSPVGELSEFASQYADVISRISGMPTLICDTDHVIAAAGVSRREFLERRVSPILDSYMSNRKSYAATGQNLGDVQPIEGVQSCAAVIYPIIASGDVMGAVVMLSGDNLKIPTGAEIKLAQSAAAFLGKQMEA
jgi:AbrB family transcriptional regulator (stage V sporulation protein T)